MSSLTAARALAQELEEFLQGDTTKIRVGLIEGALSNAEAIADQIPGFEDLEYAAAMFYPAGGREYVNVTEFEHVARMVRAELREVFGV